MTAPVLDMKTGMTPLTTLTFHSTEPDVISADLQRRRSEAPALFQGLPCLISLQELDPEHTSLASLTTLLRQHGLVPVGVRYSSEAWQAACKALCLADFGHSSVKTVRQKPAAVPAEAEQAVSEQKTRGLGLEAQSIPARAIKVHNSNVRSGQQLYFDGDLIVMGTISPGAEVLATGDIQIMGRLRGKALAGVKGNPDAMISCLQFDAQLVAIAGQYQLFEDDHPLKNSSVLVRLVDDHLTLTGSDK
ncbi:septum site-determining protein MinC [Oceanobacter sp. 5_MG-2023]|uniref:septum site-determining protein MinC n=2 Tax=Gammaproteobacteria TaxID=1236 RepID=UPI0026E22C60|nr:septum site-determining protein MinC [Oceanobacter sp. 5_MG-2023]MDO6681840.1 septum site-determining protein MinC [Oceanobacter sp. 5_MG-2023]